MSSDKKVFSLSFLVLFMTFSNDTPLESARGNREGEKVLLIEVVEDYDKRPDKPIKVFGEVN